ncbi:hypothetical protein vseg_019485 [Gypsophila vaccaria]
MGRILLVIASLFICQISIAVRAQQHRYLNQSCDDNHYRAKEYHEGNLNTVFKNLIPKSSSTKFYNFTAGDGKFQVYGLYQCREDVSLQVCSACVKDASLKIKDVCPLFPEGIVWYDECMLRYANRNIFSKAEDSEGAVRASNVTVTNYAEFAPVLKDTMNSIILKAAAEIPHFASSTKRFSVSQYLYSFAQCTPDITVSRCKECLEDAFKEMDNRCCNASIYLTMLRPSCVLRYDTTGPFLNDHSSDVPSSDGSPSANPAICK